MEMFSRYLLHLLLVLMAAVASPGEQMEAIRLAGDALARAKSWTRASMGNAAAVGVTERLTRVAWADCMELYEKSELQIAQMTGEHGAGDAIAWLSAALTSHTTCVDGLLESNALAMVDGEEQRKVTILLRRALALYSSSAALYTRGANNEKTEKNSREQVSGLLVAWDASSQAADIVVAKDGSGSYKSINEAIAAVPGWQQGGSRRIVIYVKSGVYEEIVTIDRYTRNVMLVGDGMDKTIVTGRRNVPDGYTTRSSATFGVSGDGFWARDMTFENTAGPEKHQAVALCVSSDLSIFYRCSFKGYQDTLFLLSQRQFYRDCDIYGTIDFIFGNAAAVLQNCNIIVRKPLGGQANMITAQGRDDPNQSTGISVHGSRVLPAQDFEGVKGSYKSYLGRPWKEYSRTVFMKTDLDGLVHPDGWARWSGDFAIETLFFGEYENTGDGAETSRRVTWPGFHVLSGDDEADKFTVESFIQGGEWIPESGVPYWSGLIEQHTRIRN